MTDPTRPDPIRPADDGPHGIVIEAHGGPEVMTWRPLRGLDDGTDGEPGPGRVVLDVAAAGVNFIDVYQRTGLYPLHLPARLGQEGAGVVSAVGPQVGDLTVGDEVAWLDVQGSYADRVVAPAARLVKVPQGLDLERAAAAMLQGATAHYLAMDTRPVGEGDTVLVHAAAGGVGLLLCQLARSAGARVIGTVGSAAKAEAARTAGTSEVIVTGGPTGEQDFVAAVERLVGPRAVDVVYDGVGRATFGGGLRLLRPRGMMVTFGNASGPVEPISPLELSRNGSLYLTRPALGDYVASTEELRRRCGDVLSRVRDGRLDVRIGLRLPIREAARAHIELEARRTTGKIVLHP